MNICQKEPHFKLVSTSFPSQSYSVNVNAQNERTKVILIWQCNSGGRHSYDELEAVALWAIRVSEPAIMLIWLST